jgi:hypothetical protein
LRKLNYHNAVLSSQSNPRQCRCLEVCDSLLEEAFVCDSHKGGIVKGDTTALPAGLQSYMEARKKRYPTKEKIAKDVCVLFGE